VAMPIPARPSLTAISSTRLRTDSTLRLRTTCCAVPATAQQVECAGSAVPPRWRSWAYSRSSNVDSPRILRSPNSDSSRTSNSNGGFSGQTVCPIGAAIST